MNVDMKPAGTFATPYSVEVPVLKPEMLIPGQDPEAFYFPASSAAICAGIHDLKERERFGGTIDRPARTVTTYRRVAGKMDRFRDWRFVKKGKANYAEDHAVAGHKAVYPARPFLGIDDAGERRIVGIIERHLTRAIGASGGAP